MHTNYTTAFSVNRSPEQVFAAINNVRAWWSDSIDGRTDALGATFTFHHKNLHQSAQEMTEFIPETRVVWHVASCR